MGFELLDVVVLSTDLSDRGLKAGAIGTVVHIFRDPYAYEVEFSDQSGTTIAMVTATADLIRPAAP